METRYLGKAIIQDNGTELLFVIPARKNWWIIVYTSFWLCLWLVGQLSAILFAAEGYGNPIALLWLLAWTVGGLFVFRSLLWTLRGKEVIAIDKDVLIIEKKGLLLSKTKEYETGKVTNVRVQQDGGGYVGQFVVRKDFLNAGADGIIRFDYGTQTVKFGGGLDKAGGLAIIQEMKEGHYLKESHFNGEVVRL